MRRLSLALLTSAVLVLAAARPTQAQATDPPEEVTIDACADTKAPVSFPHKAHYERLECTTCHHTQEELTLEAAQGGMEVETCAACHLEPEEEDTPSCTEKSLKKNPFHIACVSCHKDAKAEDESLSAPTKCAECHPKPEE
ncbi:MAG: cytochrome c3 family protein [Gemmatimonadales bacterium]|jgi:hypothetical protein